MIVAMPRRLAILACSLFVLGCSDPLGPDDVAGLYVLERVGSEALPAVLYENERHSVWVTSGAIRLRPDGSGTISGTQETISRHDEHSTTGPIWSEQAIRFRTTGGRIEIEFVCGPNELCPIPPHVIALRTTDGLAATYFDSPIPLHYGKAFSRE